MLPLKEKKLEQLRQKYLAGRISAEEYLRQALRIRDGDETRKAIMRGDALKRA